MESKILRQARIAYRLLAANGTGPESGERTAEILRTIDPEKTGSVVGVMGLYLRAVGGINQDKNLSPTGKNAKIRETASSWLGNVASIAETVTRLEAAHRQDADAAVPLPDADAAATLIDLAIAGHIREIKPVQYQMLAMSPRVRLALSRTPPELSGIDDAQQARVRGSLMSPEKSVRLGSEAEALAAARQIVQGAIDEIMPVSGWSPAEKVKHFGKTWRLPGVVASMAERMSTEGASTTADA